MAQGPELSTRERAVTELMGHLDSDPPTALVIVEGLSGIGKGVLFRDPRVTRSNTVILTPDELINQELFEPKTAPSTEKAGHTVLTDTTVMQIHDVPDTAHEYVIFKKIAGMLFADRGPVETMILPGMTSRETASLVATLQPSAVAAEQVALHSMGIPLLARRMARVGNIEELQRMAARHLVEAFGRGGDVHSAAAPYLQMPIPDEIVAIMGELPQARIYDRILEAFDIRKRLREQGVQEESPLFIAEESEGIYNTMLESKGVSSLDIFVPGMTAEDLARMHEALGYRPGLGYDIDHAGRADMFDANYRKVSFWHRTSNGDEFAHAEEYAQGETSLNNTLRKYQMAHREGRLSLPTELDGDASIWIHGHEHHGRTSHTANLGAMVETLLQQRGIPYFVNNDTYGVNGTSYAYTPDTEHIQVFPKKIHLGSHV